MIVRGPTGLTDCVLQGFRLEGFRALGFTGLGPGGLGFRG